MTTITKKEKEILALLQEKRYALLTSKNGSFVELGLKEAPYNDITNSIQRDICSNWCGKYELSDDQVTVIFLLVDKICNSNGEIEFDEEAQKMLAGKYCIREFFEIIRDKLDEAGIDSKYFTKKIIKLI